MAVRNHTDEFIKLRMDRRKKTPDPEKIVDSGNASLSQVLLLSMNPGP
jgi:hypothetical protein